MTHIVIRGLTPHQIAYVEPLKVRSREKGNYVVEVPHRLAVHIMADEEMGVAAKHQPFSSPVGFRMTPEGNLGFTVRVSAHSVLFETRATALPEPAVDLLSRGAAMMGTDHLRYRFAGAQQRSYGNADAERFGIDPYAFGLALRARCSTQRMILAARCSALDIAIIERVRGVARGNWPARRDGPHKDAPVWWLRYRELEPRLVSYHMTQDQWREKWDGRVTEALREINVMGLDHVIEHGWKVPNPHPDVEAWVRAWREENPDQLGRDPDDFFEVEVEMEPNL